MRYYCRVGSIGCYYYTSPDKMWFTKLLGAYFTENKTSSNVIDYTIYASIIPYKKLHTILDKLNEF
jgi:hypothetical protein